MAKSDPVAGVHIDITADSASVETAARRAGQAISRFDGLTKSMTTSITASLTRMGATIAGAFAVSGLARFAAEFIQSAAALGRFADQAGMTVQEFEGLQHALRGSGVATEQMAQGFAIFSRNMSDLGRNTGPLLDFIRRFAPALEEQFRSATSTSEAFAVLIDAINNLGSAQDRVRLVQAALGEQGARLINSMLQGRQAIEEQATAYRGLGADAAREAQRIEASYNELEAKIRLIGQRIAVSIGRLFVFMDPKTLAEVEAAITRLEREWQRLTGQGEDASGVLRELNRLWTEHARLLNSAEHALSAMAVQARAAIDGAAAAATRLSPDAIRAMQAELALFMARLQTLPPQMEFTSQSFRAAWERMQATMRATGELEAAISAARLNLLRQEDAERTRVLGNARLASEELARREAELFQARLAGLITETEHQRALTVARLEYNAAQMAALQGLGVTLSFQEQYELQLDRIRVAFEQGRISADQMGRAMQVAAFSSNASWGQALGEIGRNLQTAFGESKFLSSAIALISTWEAANRALAIYGPTPLGFAAAAAAVAAGIANVAKINSTGPGSGVPVSGGGAGGATAAPATPQPQQAITIDLHGQNFTPDMVRSLVDRINDFTQNGGTLIATVAH